MVAYFYKFNTSHFKISQVTTTTTAKRLRTMVEALPAPGLTCREDAAIAQLLALGATSSRKELPGIRKILWASFSTIDTWNRLWRPYLYHRNWQTLGTGCFIYLLCFPPENWVASTAMQPSTSSSSCYPQRLRWFYNLVLPEKARQSQGQHFYYSRIKLLLWES